MTPEEMWKRFIEELNRQQPLKEGAVHINFMGSVGSYKKIFMQANKIVEVPQK